MYRYVVILVTVFFLLNDGICDMFEEPVCSKFHFEEKVLEKLIKLEVRIDGELKQITDTTNQLETRLTTLSDSMAEIQSTVQENSQLETRLTTLSDSMAEIQSTVQENSQLETRLTTLSDSIAKIQSTVQDNSQMEDKITGLSSSIKDIIRDLQSNVSSQQTMIEKDLSAIEKGRPPVLFVAHTTSLRLKKAEPILYEQTVVNHGDGYDTTTGIFTAPVGGVYVFSAQICSVNHVNYGIVVNNNPYSYSYQYSPEEGVCSSVSTAALLSKGDRVSVNILSTGSRVVQVGYSTPVWNMFSGTLVNMLAN